MGFWNQGQSLRYKEIDSDSHQWGHEQHLLLSSMTLSCSLTRLPFMSDCWFFNCSFIPTLAYYTSVRIIEVFNQNCSCFLIASTLKQSSFSRPSPKLPRQSLNPVNRFFLILYYWHATGSLWCAFSLHATCDKPSLSTTDMFWWFLAGGCWRALPLRYYVFEMRVQWLGVMVMAGISHSS